MVDIVTTLGAAAGTYASQDKLNVEDVFSIDLYESNGGDRTIENGINLSENGGLTWIKNRGSHSTGSHYLFDTERKASENNWSPIDVVDYRVLDIIWDGTYYFGSTQSGRVIRSTDGKNWTQYFTGYGGDIQSIASDGNGNVVATVTTTQGAVNVSTNYGVSWTKYDNVISNLDWVYAVAYDPVNSLFVAGGQNGFKVASPSNLSSWSSPSSPPPLNSTTNDLLRLQWDSANNRMWALTALNDANGGGLYYSTDGWNTRTKATLPAGNATTWFWVNEAGHIGAVDSNYSFYVSTDSGSNWTVLSNGWPYGIFNDRIGRLTYDETNSRWVVANGYWNAGSAQAPTSNLQQVSYWNGTTWINESYAYGDFNSDYAYSINYANGNVFIGTDRSAVIYSNNPELNTASKHVITNDSVDQEATAKGVKSFNSNGFTIGNLSGINLTGFDFAAWTFRKAPKFFDVVTYTGDNNYLATSDSTPQTIQHNLGSIPGMIIIKNMDSAADWKVWHRSATNTSKLNTNLAFDSANNYDGSIFTVTDTSFNVGPGVSGEITVNRLGNKYVAYIFAHNDGDGEFGITGDQDIIKCGSYQGTSTDNGAEVNLGFEPQWLLVKSTDVAENWMLMDVMRGMPFNLSVNDDPTTYRLYPNTTANETETSRLISPLPTGFKVCDANNLVNDSNSSYIYVAIRRPMAVPTSGTEVFAIDRSGITSPTPPRYNSGFPIDMALRKTVDQVGNWELLTRLRQGSSLRPNGTNIQDNGSAADMFDYNNGYNYQTTVDINQYSWMWKRAPKFFDVVNYLGDGSGIHSVYHNLESIPEMIWIKQTDGLPGDWVVWHKDLDNPATEYLYLNTADEASSQTANVWYQPSTEFRDTFFTVGSSADVNDNNRSYVAYLFASLDGVSKVGSFSGDSTSNRVIDCGFTSGARFVLVKCITQGGTQWFVFDSVRGITTGNDPVVLLNADNQQQTTLDMIAPHSSGFAVNFYEFEAFNQTGLDYVFYAIA